VILVLVMNALGASSSAVSGRPTPPTGVPVWAVLLSHVPGQTVYMHADQPLVLAWRLDLDAVQAVAQWSGIEDGVRAGDLVFGLVVDGELATSQGLPASGSTDQLTFQLRVGSACNAGRCQVESDRLSLQLVMSGPNGPIGRMTELMELIVRDEHELKNRDCPGSLHSPDLSSQDESAKWLCLQSERLHRHSNCRFNRQTRKWTLDENKEFDHENWIQDLLDRDCPKIPPSQGCQSEILDTIFCVIGAENRFYVEYGFNSMQQCSGTGPNTCKLWRDHWWSGLLLDDSRENPEINLRRHALFESNAASVLLRYGVPKELDYLSSDMDSHDIFVLHGILHSGFRPRIVSTEYNCNFDLNSSFAQVDPEYLSNDGGHQFAFRGCLWGASAAAWRTLMTDFGYTLVGISPRLDLFWIRNDLIDERWLIPPFERFFEKPKALQVETGLHPQASWDDFDTFVLDYDEFYRTGQVSSAQQTLRKRVYFLWQQNQTPYCLKNIVPLVIQHFKAESTLSQTTRDSEEQTTEMVKTIPRPSLSTIENPFIHRPWTASATVLTGETDKTQLRFRLHHTLVGRLGNQLFQWASTMGIASARGMESCIKGGDLSHYFDGVDDNCIIQQSGRQVSEQGRYATHILFEIQGDTVLNGYFQSWKYFDADMQVRLRFKPDIQADAAAVLQQFRSSVTVGIHVRYKHQTEVAYLRFPPRSYFEQSMRSFRLKHKAVKFVVASDDPVWCSKQSIFQDPDVHVLAERSMPALDMAILVGCDHMITTVGSFGWWAAYLGADAKGGEVLWTSDSDL
jgi:galactoside 2-L-fucosyltransferase 1/2